MFDWLRPRRDLYVVEWRLVTEEGAQRIFGWWEGPLGPATLDLLDVPWSWERGGFQGRDKATGEVIVRRNFRAFEDLPAAEQFFENWDELSRQPSPFVGNRCFLWRCRSRTVERAPHDLVFGADP